MIEGFGSPALRWRWLDKGERLLPRPERDAQMNRFWVKFSNSNPRIGNHSYGWFIEVELENGQRLLCEALPSPSQPVVHPGA